MAFSKVKQVRIVTQDFLLSTEEPFDYVIGNPPYVSIGNLSVIEREAYRKQYASARGRFDLYMLFFEKSLRLLSPEGRLVFVTPEKFTYVNAARALRRVLMSRSIESLHFISEATFDGYVTYPVVTTVGRLDDQSLTTVTSRRGEVRTVRLTRDDSWQAVLMGETHCESGPTLADVCVRISCGIATGADDAFVVASGELAPELRPFAYPTLGGRQIRRTGPIHPQAYMLVPYDRNGRLLPEDALGPLKPFLSDAGRERQLRNRTCASRKPWYAFHDSAPLNEILRPKILCKDISERPFFVADEPGAIVPRHSVYYIVPKDPSLLPSLLELLNSADTTRWLLANCQRAANGFVRVQSSVLKRLPIPTALAAPFLRSSQIPLAALAASA